MSRVDLGSCFYAVTEDTKTRLLVVDDQRMFAESVARLLGEEPDFEVVGVAATAAEAVEMVARLRPDVAVVDFNLPDGDGASITRSIVANHPETKVLILTGSVRDENLLEAIESGCAGFLTKDKALDELVNAVRLASVGEAYIPTPLLSLLVPRLRGGRREGVGADLTPKELEILELLHHGLSTSAIAQEQYLSVNTVRNHVQHILTKLGAHSKIEAMAIARNAGLFDARPPGGRN